MWRNYWTVAVRALAKNRTYSIINIAGLAIGMAACVMILLYIRYEESYDKWLPDVENTYELQSWYPHPKDQPPGFFQMGTYVAQATIKKKIPQGGRGAGGRGGGPGGRGGGRAGATGGGGGASDDF